MRLVRKEIKKVKLQEKVYRDWGVVIENPEMLVQLALDQYYDEIIAIYEDYDKETIIIEALVYCRRTRRP